MAAGADPPQVAPAAKRVSLRDLFSIFLRAGLAFGGGLGILAVLEDELVTKRQALSRDDFLTTYSLGRVVPSGTMTALAVAYGYQLGGWAGTAVALAALTLPAFLLTVALTAAYGLLSGQTFFDLLGVTVLPAALGFIVIAALRLGRDVFRPSPDLFLALGAFVGAAVLDLNPALLLLLSGVVGIWVCRWSGKTVDGSA